MKIPKLSFFNKILHNCFVLYFLFLFSLLVVFYLAFQRDFLNASILILVGFITSFFTKNMIVVFLLSLTMTAIVKYAKVKNTEGFTDEDVEAEDTEDVENEDEENEDAEEEEEEEIIKNNDKKKKKFAATQQEPMIADPEELDADSNLKKKKTNDNELDKIQEQTKILLDTHNELIKNIDSLKPYLKEANNFSKSVSKLMNGGSEGAPWSNATPFKDR